jgi:hypothetical protein
MAVGPGGELQADPVNVQFFVIEHVDSLSSTSTALRAEYECEYDGMANTS